jgi:hypothetical protein
MAYLSAGFFALGIPVAIVGMIPNSTYLELDPQAFTFCNLFKRTTISWCDIEEFVVFSQQHRGMTVRRSVGFNFVASYDRARTGRMIMRAYPNVKVEIGGYTDNTSDSAHNLELSRARASAAMEQIANQGIDRARLSAQGYGEQNPVADNSTAEGRQRNRRVDIRVTEK